MRMPSVLEDLFKRDTPAGWISEKPEFLVGLAQAYVAAGLANAAEKELTKIPPVHSLYPLPMATLLQAMQQRSNHSGVLELGDRLLREGDSWSWVTTFMGCAAFMSGRYEEARKYFEPWFEWMPTNQEVTSALHSLAAGNLRPRLEILLPGAVQMGFSPHAVVDCLAPVLSGARPATCAFQDQFWLVNADWSAEDKRKAFVRLAEFLFSSFGIFTAFQRYMQCGGEKPSAIGKIYFSFQRRLSDEVAGIETVVWEDAEATRSGSGKFPESIEREGLLLGYPACFTRWAAALRTNGGTFEGEATKALIREEGISRFLGVEKVPRPALAYFAFEFFPCHPRCNEAEGQGSEILRRYEQIDPMLAAVYRLHGLPLNRVQVAKPGVVYGERTRKFDSDLLEICDGPHFDFPKPEAV